jgi:cytochrome b561
MKLTNSLTEYGLISKIFHWLSAAVLLAQIPLGFYLVDLDFSDKRLTIESIHVTLGLIIFYLTVLRLFYKLINPTPALTNSIFPGQKIIAKLNHIFLYISILVITISGALKKLFNGEILYLFFFDLEIKDNFDLAELFYVIHIFGNYTLIALILLHISAVIIHKILFKENLFRRIL